MTMKAFQLMGMKCCKCQKRIGAMCIPEDSSWAPESLGGFLALSLIRPICKECMENNPLQYSHKNMVKGK